MADDLCPAIDVRQPADRAPRDKHHVEGCHVRDRGRRIIAVRLHEARPFGKPQFIGKLPRGVDSGCREVQSDDLGTALCKLQAVGAEMTLQMQDAAAIDRPEFHLFDGAEAATPGSQSRKIVAARDQMQGDFLIPIGTVSRFPFWFIHERRSCWKLKHRPICDNRQWPLNTLEPPLATGRSRPNCDIGRAVSWRPLPDPTADLWTLSVLAKESGRL